ncbi:hypothetical protein J5500_01210 [Candidatus Saccharibacteria bacterium]|nr:hypothetical protein [Candidatus Saccharibacteria bacterium]
MIDIHSHVLPGIDDGAKTFDDSLAILKGLAEQDITDLILTPHYVASSTYVSPRSANLKLYRQLQAISDGAKLGITLHLGNEIYIDRDIAKLIKAGKISTLADSKYILVELPMSGEFNDFEDILVSLQYTGWQVILAHPERYHTYHEDYKKIYELTEQGILLQCNLGSIVGQYGRHAKKNIKKLAKDKLIFCFGTDTHHVRDFSEITKARRKLRRYYSDEELKQLLEDNPRKIINS